MMRPYYLIAALAILADQTAKALVLALMKPGQSFPLVQNILHLTYVRNTGAAVGMFQGSNALLIGAAALAALFLLYAMRRIPQEKVYYRVGLILVLSGSAGNIIDRVFRGFVVDMIDFRFFPVFNLADVCINLGVATIVAAYIIGKSMQKHARVSQ